jgi:hypothetical protein
MKEKNIEKNCQYHGPVRHILEGRGSYRCTKCRSEAVQRRRDKLKQKAINYKGGKCEKCGYSKCTAALDFHHVEPEHKDFAIAKSGITRSWDKIKIELDKCILVCANCHREEHAKEHNEKKEVQNDRKRKYTGLVHGTRNAYTHYKCRCELCKKANAEHCKKYKKNIHRKRLSAYRR